MDLDQNGRSISSAYVGVSRLILYYVENVKKLIK